jgi:hypothetical protein
VIGIPGHVGANSGQQTSRTLGSISQPIAMEMALEAQHVRYAFKRGNAAAASPPRRRRGTARVSVGVVGDCGSEIACRLGSLS